MIKEFGEWTPDAAPLKAGALTARNVIADDDGYAPAPGPEPVGTAILPEAPLAMAAATSSDGVAAPLIFCPARTYRAGLADFLPCPGSDLVSEFWDFAPWGDNLYAVNGVDPLQKIDLIGGAAFRAVDVPNGLTAKSIAVVADVMALGYLIENRGAQIYPYRVGWSGLQRPETYIPSLQTQSSYQDVADIGEIRRVTGGEFGLVLGADGTSRMDYVNVPEIFTFRTVEVGVGCALPRTVVRQGDRVIWWSKRGWRMSTGGPSVAIGDGRVDAWFRARMNPAYPNRIMTLVLPEQDVICWLFASINSQYGFPDECLFYSWSRGQLGKWTMGNLGVKAIGMSIAPSPYTDDPVLPFAVGGVLADDCFTDLFDVITDAFDAGDPYASAITNDGRLARLVPNKLRAEVETGELQLSKRGKANLAKIKPIVEGASDARAIVSVRDQTDQVNLRQSPELKQERGGRMRVNMKANFHRVRLIVDPPFTSIIGVDFVEILEAGNGR